MSSGSPSIAIVPTATPLEPMPGIAADDDRLPRRPVQWLALMVVAAIVGAGAGLVGGTFRLALVWLDDSRTNMAKMVFAHVPHAVGWLIPTAFCAAGAYVSVWLTQKLAPQTAGSGIPRVEAALRTHLDPVGAVTLPVKFIGGVLSIGSGLALGREGPTVQMGGTIGRLVGDWLRRIIPEPWTLIAAGAGAGLAVAFNAPLAAALFVMEELLHRFSARVFSASLIACITGTVVLRAIVSNATDFSVASFGVVPAGVLPNYLLMGIVAGFFGVAFNVTLLAALRLFDRADRWPRGMKGAVVGAGAGLVAWYAPTVVGGGENVAQFALGSHVAMRLIVALLLFRFVLTTASYGCGAPGGIFAPLLALGALLGNAYASATAHLTHVHAAPAVYAIVAMAACFTATVRSPLTGVVLLLEMTGGWTLILPMMAASLTAYAVPELLGNPPIYDSLRERDESREKELRARNAR